MWCDVMYVCNVFMYVMYLCMCVCHVFVFVMHLWLYVFCRYVGVYVCISVCLYVCMSLSIYLLIYQSIYLPIYASIYASRHLCIHASMHLCILHLYIYVSMYLCRVYEPMYPCIDVFLYLCIRACIHVCFSACMLTHLCVFVWIGMHLRVSVCRCTYLFISVYICMYLNVSECRLRMCIHIYIYTCIYIQYIYIYIQYIYTYSVYIYIYSICHIYHILRVCACVFICIMYCRKRGREGEGKSSSPFKMLSVAEKLKTCWNPLFHPLQTSLRTCAKCGCICIDTTLSMLWFLAAAMNRCASIPQVAQARNHELQESTAKIIECQ